MFPRICFFFGLLSASAWSQLGVVPYQTPVESTETDRMQTPPPVSGVSYPTLLGSETRSNYLGVGLTVNTAYNDNVLAIGNSTPVNDTTFSLLPGINFDKTTPRQHLALVYTPGFTFYQHTTSLDSTTQAALINFQYHVRQYTTLRVSDSVQKSSNIFDQLYPSSGSNVSGSIDAPTTPVTVPYANFFSNVATLGLNHQMSRNSMLGASGIATAYSYPNQNQASNLYNSTSLGGGIFYSRRVSEKQYLGLTYQYLRTAANPANSESVQILYPATVQIHSILALYTIYLSPVFSISLSTGPQYFDAVQFSSPPSHSLRPSIMASTGWQKSHANLTASYSKTVTASNGLPGAYDSSNVNVSGRWQAAGTWTVALAGIYFIDKNVTPLFLPSTPGGHTISGSASAQHSISEQFKAEVGYAHVHQSYGGISVISQAPDSNRVYISVSYQLTQPLGR